MFEDAAFLVGEPGQLGGLLRALAYSVDYAPGHGRVEQGLPGGNSPNGVDQVAASDLLEQVAGRPRHDRGEQSLVIVVRREDQRTDAGIDRADVATHRDTAAVGQASVQDGDVRSVDPSIRALILTSYDDDEALFAAIMAGADGYLLKQIGGGDLVDAVRRVAAGQSLLDPAVTRRVIDRLRQGPAQPTELAELTDQERRVLELVAEGLTNKQIAEAMFLAEKTIKNYVSSVLSKLGLERRTQAAVFATKMLGNRGTR